VLAANGCVSGSSNVACCFYAVWVPGPGGGVAVAAFDIGELTDVRPACSNGHANLPTSLSRPWLPSPALSSQTLRATNGKCAQAKRGLPGVSRGGGVGGRNVMGTYRF
jgi:hypothetical protein